MKDCLPDDIEIPAELEAAWTWMEEQGWGGTDAEGRYFLTPYAGEAQRGVVFTAASLDGWFDPGSEAPLRLLPLAKIAGDGSIGAVWTDDAGAGRFVALGSEGSAHLLADTALDFLRLIAVGYDELGEWSLGLEPEDEESVEAHAQFRAWLERTYGVEAPSEWEAVDPEDEFAQWIAAQSGEELPVSEAVPEGLPADVVSGDVATVLAALGQPDGAQRLAALVELPDAAAPKLRKAGVEFAQRRGAVATIWIDTAAYPHPERLLPGSLRTQAQVIAALGEPECRGEGWVRYVIGGRYLHLQLDPERGITGYTFMVDAP